MASKVLVGDTAYVIYQGATKIDGTNYYINAGRTLVSSTGYDITFSENLSFSDLIKNSGTTIGNIAGRNSSSNGSITKSISDTGTYYVFSVYNGYMGIYKVVYDGSNVTKSTIYQQSTSYANVLADINSSKLRLRYAHTTSASSVRGATIFTLQNTTFPMLDIEKCLSSLTASKLDSNNSSTQKQLSGSTTNWTAGRFVLGTVGAIVNIYERASDGSSYFQRIENPERTLTVYTSTVKSTDASGNAKNVYGGSIILFY